MNNESARKQLKEIERQRNLIGVGGYKSSRRDRNERHELFCKTMKESELLRDKMKLKGGQSEKD